MVTAYSGMQGDKGGAVQKGEVDEVAEADGITDDCQCVTHPLGEDTVLLSSLLYEYLMDNFESIHLILNTRKVKDSLVRHVKEKVRELRMHVEDCKHASQDEGKTKLLRYDPSLQMVSQIHLDGLLLLSTDETDVEYNHNLVKVGIDLHLDRGVATVISNECTLISRKWNYDLDGIVTGKGKMVDGNSKEAQEKGLNGVDTSKEVATQNQLKVVLRRNVMKDTDALHSIDARITQNDEREIVNRLLSAIKLHSVSGETKLEDKKKKILFQNFHEWCCPLTPSANDIRSRIHRINTLLFDLFEPEFYNSTLKKSNSIGYKELYEQYHNIMIKSRYIKMNDIFVEYLLLDSVFLPSYVKRNTLRAVQEEDNEYSSLDSYSDTSSEESQDGTHSEMKSAHMVCSTDVKEETKLGCHESDLTQSYIQDDKCEKRKRQNLFKSEQFRSQLEEIQEAIESLNGSVFLRVNNKNLRKGSFVNNFSLEVNTLYDALLMLKSSTDVYKVLKQKETNRDNYIILSKYVNLNLCFLFDVYVYSNSIVAVSQKCLNYYFDFLSKPDVIEEIIQTIRIFFEKHIKESFPQDHYILQLYIHTFKRTKKKKVLLINAKRWLFKNKHPVLTNKIFTNYLFTDGVDAPAGGGAEGGTDVGHPNGTGIYKIDASSFEVEPLKVLKRVSGEVHMATGTKGRPQHCTQEKEGGKNEGGTVKEETHSDLYICDGILYYCITKDEAIYKKNANLYPKDLNYVKEGEIDMDSLLETIKMQNEGAPRDDTAPC
ncbi:D123 family, putative [Plasmodium knowlesi strain H]|uniref:D123 family, putative n=3 Tax=Plasmodium knowlesi TaxID=5850 RepID=A0A5K1VE04_PLAKH|nr:D123 family, putative [Plasmodium knowlesi strain H]OTN65829.1 putative D123 family [Plasmodium knowlesi]CAA9987827.1 D123 family, putative [Plasmodium knowlesi strain H]SBO22364.1 D123 family, putative [Plasmodium knowlesi strain H]SBO28760.1 D123 family, putative [Plasmodium knowlesi strain H]VVS77301.1 D123 family, putative [Plasmodium knowlesi strain H]|eukprot:XP_002258825.1 D123 family, putative [Plasmodium knowlesi strain H]